MRGTDYRRWIEHREPSEEATMVQVRVDRTRGLEEERAVRSLGTTELTGLSVMNFIGVGGGQE